MSISPADIETFEQDGFLLLRSVFDQATITSWIRGWEALKTSAQSGDVSRNDRFFYGVLPSPLGTVYRAPALVDIVNRMVGEDVALYFNRMRAKDEAWNGPVAAHQDMPYFHGTNKLSIFVPIRPFNLQNGGLSFMKGSHKFGIQGHGAIDVKSFGLESVTPDAQPGDIILMDVMTWHYSKPALVSTDRPVMQLAYQPTTDGSYYGDLLGVAEPTLVTGSWRTGHFIRFQQGLTPDGASVPATSAVGQAAPPALEIIDVLDVSKFSIETDWYGASVNARQPVPITTVTSQWEYSAALPVQQLTGHAPAASHFLSIELQVRDGTVGVALLSQGDLKHEQFVSDKQYRTVVFVPTEENMDYLIIRNARAGARAFLVEVLDVKVVRSDIDTSCVN